MNAPPTSMEFMPMQIPMSMAMAPTFMTQESEDRARAYKSRNKRPCDFCRYKKAACHLESAPPCELCSRYGKECTFVESPAKRRRPNEEHQHLEEQQHLESSQQQQHPQQLPLEQAAQYNGMNGFHAASNELLGWEQPAVPYYPGLQPEFDFNHNAYNQTIFEQFEYVNPCTAPSIQTTSSLPPEKANPQEASLDKQSNSNALLVGISGEADPYLLRHYKYDANNECSFQQVRMRRVGDNNGMPVHFMIQQNKLAAKAQPAETQETFDLWRKEMKDVVSDEVGKRLIKLFFEHMNAFPVILRSQCMQDGEFDPDLLPTCLLSSIYGHALPFCIFDEQLCVEVYTPPSADALFRMAWRAANARFHTPVLSVVQTLLLLVQRRPTNKHVADTPTKAVMMSACVSIAQALGLNLDPSSWNIPLWEKRLRKRLAWGVFSQEKWISLNLGRGSHINADDWDVGMLQAEDLVEPGDESNLTPDHEQFLHLCELSEIVDDVLRSLFSVKASRALWRSLDKTLDVAKPLRSRLTQWHQNLTPNMSITKRDRQAHELNAHGSLHLAYLTAKMELFRAMLRPQGMNSNAHACSAVRTGAMGVAKEVLDLLEALKENHFEAFWPSYSRTNFTIASNFMLLLFATSTTLVDAKESLHLLTAWRSLLRIKSRRCDMLNLALLRLDATYVTGIDKLIELSPAALTVYQEQTIKTERV